MGDETIAIDENGRNGMAGITNDVNQFILNARINPITNRLICEAVVTSSNTSIGSTIPGGIQGSVLFLGVGGTLAQDNANFFYDDAQNFLGLGTNTPSATLHVDGSVEFDLGGDASGDIFYRASSGLITPLPIGTVGQVLTVTSSLPSWENATSSDGYNQIQDDDIDVLPQRQILNFKDFFTVVDNVSNASTDVYINVTELANDTTFVTDLVNNNIFTTLLGGDTNFIDTLVANTYFLTSLTSSTTFIDDLIANNYFTTNLANNTNFINTLTNNSTFQTNITTIINNSPTLSIDLATQVTGVLPLANGGTGAALSDPGYNAAYVWDDTTNATRLAHLSGLSYNSGTNTLTASAGSGGPVTIQTFTSSGTYTKPVGLVSAIVEVVGGGGGGGGTSISASIPGAGGGAYVKKVFAAASIGSTETVTIGNGGIGGATPSTNPTNGGTSSFGSLLTALGGSLSSNNGSTAGAGAIASGGNVNINGGTGGAGIAASTGAGRVGGTGGYSFMGGGSPGAIADAGGSNGVGYGSGGGGAAKNGTANVSGGAGAKGIVIVTEYYS